MYVPASLMGSPYALPAVRVEEFVETNIITEVRVGVQLLAATVRRTTTFHVTTKDVDDAVLYLLGDTGQVHVVAAACRTFDLTS